MFSWPTVAVEMEHACQTMSVILPPPNVAVNGDVPLGYIEPHITSNFNNNQQHGRPQQHGGAFVQPVIHDITDQQQSLPLSALTNVSQQHAGAQQHVGVLQHAGSYVLPATHDITDQQQSVPLCSHLTDALSSVRVARPILGAAANLGRPPHTGLPTISTMPEVTTPATVDVTAQPARPPNNSDNIQNGRLWPTPPPLTCVDSASCVRGPTPSSSPVAMMQPPDSLSNAQFLASQYFFLPPPSTTVQTDTSLSGPAPVPATSANICTAGCCQCGQCHVPPLSPYTYAYPPFMIPNSTPFLPRFGYAVPGLAFAPPSMPAVSHSGTYTQSSDLVYNSRPPMFTLMPQFQRPPPPTQAPIPSPPSNPGRGLPLKPSPVVTVPFNPMMPPPSAHVAGRRNGSRNTSCFNCGQLGHQASVCLEPFLPASTHTGTRCLLVLVVRSHSTTSCLMYAAFLTQ